MKIAITGGTGFVGSHLVERLVSEGHEVVLIARHQLTTLAGEDACAPTFISSDLSDTAELIKAFAGCDGIAHCAGINREVGEQTFQRVHVDATRNVVTAAKSAGVSKIVLMSFLRARPDCDSLYHESKWASEELIRESGLDYTVIKAGVVYGRGDHMLDHLSHALHTFPFFATVGCEDKTVRPLAIEDLIYVMRAALVDRRLKRQTIALVGPEEIYLTEAVRRVAEVVGKQPLMFPLPVWWHQVMATIFEVTMKVPLASLAQIRILSEGVAEASTTTTPLPYDLIPTRRFTFEQIRNGLPESGSFGFGDLRWCS